MKIFLNQQEIEEAVREHIEKSVALKEGSEMSLDFLAGRGENGISVTVDIKYMGVEALDLSTGTKETAKPPKAAAAAVPKTTLPKTKGATTVGGGLAGAAQSVVGKSKPFDLSTPDAATAAAEAGAEATTAATEPSTDVVDAGDGSQDAEAGTTAGEEAAAASTEAAADTDAKPVKSLFS